MDDLLTEFLTETTESLAELDVALLRLERVPGDQSTLTLIFRLMHTIKGTCGFFGLSRLEKVAHAAENVLCRLRDGELVATPALITTVLAAIDTIKAIVAGLSATGSEPAGDDAPLIARLTQAEPEPARVTPEPVDIAGPRTIRVSVEVLETLMTLVSELVLTRNRLLQIARARERQDSETASAFAPPLQRLSQITSDLREGVMKTRMQPIGNAWNTLPRLVRDLALDLGKQIELVTSGAETELDRQVLDLIRDPLTHMVRNSADHGIEQPEDRRAAGKPETGRISLSASHEGGHIVIGLEDDGRGLDVARIRARAAARGLGTEVDLAALPEAEIHRLIFHPGFSTADSVTSVSGRGVGMDVVMTNIQRIGGTIEWRSRFGEGTRFIIKIPLTLAIVSALIVEAAGERFAIPQLTVAELVRARPAGGTAAVGGGTVIEHLNGTPVLRLRNRLLPLVSLAALLRLDPPEQAAEEASRHVIVAQGSGCPLGIVVDRVVDTEEIVVKPVSPILRHLTVFGGTTILGDGSVIMILDPAGIARAAGIAGDGRGDGRLDQRRGGITGAAHGDDRTTILLVRAGGDLLAVPLGLVARLEEIPCDRIEYADGALAVTRYRGQLMPLIPISGALDRERVAQMVVVFSQPREDGGPDQRTGLVVDEIVDVIEQPLHVALASTRPGLLGTAMIDGRAAGVLDMRHWLTRATGDGFGDGHAATASLGSLA